MQIHYLVSYLFILYVVLPRGAIPYRFVDFSLLCHFRIYTDRTIGYMRRYLEDFMRPRIFFLSFELIRKQRLRQSGLEV